MKNLAVSLLVTSVCFSATTLWATTYTCSVHARFATDSNESSYAEKLLGNFTIKSPSADDADFFFYDSYVYRCGTTYDASENKMPAFICSLFKQTHASAEDVTFTDLGTAFTSSGAPLGMITEVASEDGPTRKTAVALVCEPSHQSK